METAVGKDLYSVCGKCGDMYHVVVAMLHGKVTRVQCKQCNGYHRYRAPAGEEDVNKTKKKAAKKKTTRKKKAAPKKAEPLIEPDMSKPIRDYSIRDTYEPGERIEHPKFGQGIVESLPGPKKISVFFEDRRRTLVMAR